MARKQRVFFNYVMSQVYLLLFPIIIALWAFGAISLTLLFVLIVANIALGLWLSKRGKKEIRAIVADIAKQAEAAGDQSATAVDDIK